MADDAEQAAQADVDSTLMARIAAGDQRAIAALSDRRREVFILSRFHGLSHGEIAETLQTSPQTVANQVSSALAELRLALSHLLHDD